MTVWSALPISKVVFINSSVVRTFQRFFKYSNLLEKVRAVEKTYLCLLSFREEVLNSECFRLFSYMGGLERVFPTVCWLAGKSIRPE